MIIHKRIKFLEKLTVAAMLWLVGIMGYQYLVLGSAYYNMIVMSNIFVVLSFMFAAIIADTLIDWGYPLFWTQPGYTENSIEIIMRPDNISTIQVRAGSVSTYFEIDETFKNAEFESMTKTINEIITQKPTVFFVALLYALSKRTWIKSQPPRGAP